MADEPSDYWGWIAEGRYDHEWTVYDQYLKPQHTFIDLGAWVGAHSLYASTITRHVYAVEPDPVAFAILEQNVKGKSIDLRCYAIAGHRGQVTIGSGFLGASTTRKNLAAGGGIGAAVAEHTVTVLCTTLRDLAYEHFPHFIKMDIEGMEEEVFKDAAFFHERKPALFVELHPFWWEDEQQTWKDFEKVKAAYKVHFEVPHKNSNTWILEN